MISLEDSLKELFVDLHKSGIWSDGKSVSDSVLLAPPEVILERYRAESAHEPVDLGAFYRRHFRPVRTGSGSLEAVPGETALEHLDRVWSRLKRPADDPAHRSTRIPVPEPYVVAGGRFQEAYYWDSYFIQLGLLRTRQIGAVRSMIDNFDHVIQRFGHIPNGFRTYFLTRSQPPFFAMMVEDFGLATGDREEVYARYLPQMEAEHRYFTAAPRDHQGLSRYWDDGDRPRVEMYGDDLYWQEVAAARPGFYRDLRAACESGWDFSSRWLADPDDFKTIRTTDIWAVDLNSILLRCEEIIADARDMTGKDPVPFVAAADRRRAAIRSRMWDEERGYFFDRVISDDVLSERNTAAGLFPLWAGAASDEQAERAADWAERTLLAPGGLHTTDLSSGEQWDRPNGWAPLQWIAVKGLRRYGFGELAEAIRARWIRTCDLVFAEEGKFVEKYDVAHPGTPSTGGEYALQDGFGWSNGVYLDFVLEKRGAKGRD